MEDKESRFEYEKTIKQGYQLPILRYLNLDRFLNRPIGGLIVKAIYHTRITPNQLTYASFMLMVGGAVFYCLGQYRFFLIAAALQLLANILDSADGMLARAKGMCSTFGTTLDLLLDRIGDFFLYGSITVAYYLSTHDLRLAVAGLAGLAAFNLQVIIYYLVETFKQVSKTGMTGEVRGFIGWVIAICTVLNRLDILLWIMIVEPVLNVTFMVFYFHTLRKRQPS